MLSSNSPTGPVTFTFTPQSGPVGSTVRIFPNDDAIFLTAVQFNGINAVFAPNFETGGFNATVPQGATTGKIKLVYFGGSSTSTLNFTVSGAPVVNVPTISNFTPATGAAGTVVQINGTNLGNVGEARVNGVNAFIRLVTPTRVDIEVPQGATTGRIVLSGPDGTATSPGDFVVPVQSGGPTISSFCPGSGKPGDAINIFGTGFTNVFQVFFNGVPSGFSPINSGQITANVPSGATTGRISVQTGAGTGTSLQDFQIQSTVGLPVINSFSPGSGKAGDVITLSGNNLGQITAASINFTPCNFVLSSNVTLTLTVPQGATTGRIRLTNAAGQGVSAQDFVVTTPAMKPVINSFTPTSGMAGTQISILGQFFAGTTQVVIGTKTATFNLQNDTLITAIVPTGAVTGPVVVTNAVGSTSSSTNFQVGTGTTLAPVITGFSPLSGAVGSLVTVQGQNLAGILSARLGSIAVQAQNSTATSFAFLVPQGAVTGLIQVTTANGSTQSNAAFQVASPAQLPPVISNFTPGSGAVGSIVTVNGQNFTGVTSVRLGTKEVTPMNVQPTSLMFMVPTGATTGKIQVTTAAGTATSTLDFTVSVTPPVPQPVAFNVNPVQLADEDDIVPLVNNEDRPDFEPTSDTVGVVRLISGQNKSFTLIAKRFDLMPDKVQVLLFEGSQPSGLVIDLPVNPVDANTPFKVKVKTNRILTEGTYKFKIGGISTLNSQIVYSPFDLTVEVTPPIEFRFKDEARVSPGKTSKVNIAVIRRTYNLEVKFGVAVTAPNVTVTRSNLIKTEVMVGERGGLKDTYELTFTAAPQASGGEFDVRYTVTAPTDYRIKIPRQPLFVEVVPKLVVVGESKKSVSPDMEVRFDVEAVPNGLAGPFVVKVKPGPAPTSTDLTMPSITVDASNGFRGTLKIFARTAAKQGTYNYLLNLESQTGTLFDQQPIMIEVTGEKVAFFPSRNPVSVFENESFLYRVDFDRLMGFTDSFLLDVVQPDFATVTLEGNREVGATEKFRNLRIQSNGNVPVAKSAFTIVAKDKTETGMAISKELVVDLLGRRRETLLELNPTTVTLSGGEMKTLTLRFQPAVTLGMPALGEAESVDVTLGINVAPGNITLKEPGGTAATQITVRLNARKPQVELTLEGNPNFKTLGNFVVQGTYVLNAGTGRMVNGRVNVVNITYQGGRSIAEPPTVKEPVVRKPAVRGLNPDNPELI